MAQSYRLVSMDSQEIRDMLDNSENETDSKLTYMESIDLFRPSEHENEQMVPDEDEDESSSLSQDPNYQPGSDSEVEASLSENRNQDNVEIVTNTPKSGTGRKRSRGRPQNQVWLEFITVTRGKNFISNKCKHCKEQVSAQSSRMENHLKKCRKFNKTPVSQGLPTPISPPVGKESAATTKITNFMYKMLPRTKDKLDESLGKFIYSANLPFNVVENEYFCKFVGLLNPSYVLPKHETVGGFLLDNEFKRTELELTKQLENQKVVLAQDGWSTIQQEPVIAHSAICNGQSFFLGAEATGGYPKTAEFCYSLFEKQLKQLETINCEVVGLVTDNCNTMLALQNLVKKNNPNVIVYGCSPHLLNLVGQHYTNKELMDKVIQVQKYFRNHYYARADLKSSKGKRPVLPMPVRWNSQTDCWDGLTEVEKEKGRKILNKKGTLYLLAAMDLHNSDASVFSETMLLESSTRSIPPQKWWRAANQNKLPKGFTEFAVSLFNLPAGTASLERNFSSLGNILTKKRNRLGVEKASKLCRVNQTLHKTGEEKVPTSRKRKWFDSINSDENM
ncbi:hypothetical protein Fcan01_10606 [Folsomia candida]|uniref:BED-type domain-containing protein n=2 Tax=Folsomia candida TaxID=158441 RepID=A0A226E8W7_FOLCA|nr:hypothetical protein Fcan01_10606 [Folsomia candida]